jgi:hypothetical protein
MLCAHNPPPTASFQSRILTNSAKALNFPFCAANNRKMKKCDKRKSGFTRNLPIINIVKKVFGQFIFNRFLTAVIESLKNSNTFLELAVKMKKIDKAS